MVQAPVAACVAECERSILFFCKSLLFHDKLLGSSDEGRLVAMLYFAGSLLLGVSIRSSGDCFRGGGGRAPEPLPHRTLGRLTGGGLNPRKAKQWASGWGYFGSVTCCSPPRTRSPELLRN
jgi:hypothetical protein